MPPAKIAKLIHLNSSCAAKVFESVLLASSARTAPTATRSTRKIPAPKISRRFIIGPHSAAARATAASDSQFPRKAAAPSVPRLSRQPLVHRKSVPWPRPPAWPLWLVPLLTFPRAHPALSFAPSLVRRTLWLALRAGRLDTLSLSQLRLPARLPRPSARPPFAHRARPSLSAAA